METIKQPTLFVSHGAPTLPLDDSETAQFLKTLAWPAPPKAIIAISAHWTTAQPTLSSHPHPPMIYDFYGFPAPLYKLQYPAPGDPALAARVRDLLAKSGLSAQLDPARGFDHGVWTPLLLLWPEARIPVVPLSVQPGRDAAWHYRIGQQLAALRDEGILIFASGNLTHNLREAFGAPRTRTPRWVTEFADWVEQRLADGDIDALLDWENAAPHALRNHPTPEHFLPLFVALGAAGEAGRSTMLHRSIDMDVLAMDAYRFD